MFHDAKQIAEIKAANLGDLNTFLYAIQAKFNIDFRVISVSPDRSFLNKGGEVAALLETQGTLKEEMSDGFSGVSVFAPFGKAV